MPVRARSRASRSSRKASQFWLMPRSSSRSASTPAAMTPPSRSSTAGSSAMARSASASAGSGASAACRRSSSGVPAGATRAQRRQRGQRGAQAGQFARAHLAQGGARGDALDVADAAQRLAQRLEALRDERGDGLVALAGRRAAAAGVREPVAQQPAAHAGAAGVEQAQQRGRCLRRAASAPAPGCGAWPAAVRAGRWRVPRSACARGPARGPGCARQSSAARRRRRGPPPGPAR